MFAHDDCRLQNCLCAKRHLSEGLVETILHNVFSRYQCNVPIPTPDWDERAGFSHVLPVPPVRASFRDLLMCDEVQRLVAPVMLFWSIESASASYPIPLEQNLKNILERARDLGWLTIHDDVHYEWNYCPQFSSGSPCGLPDAPCLLIHAVCPRRTSQGLVLSGCTCPRFHPPLTRATLLVDWNWVFQLSRPQSTKRELNMVQMASELEKIYNVRFERKAVFGCLDRKNGEDTLEVYTVWYLYYSTRKNSKTTHLFCCFPHVQRLGKSDFYYLKANQFDICAFPKDISRPDCSFCGKTIHAIKQPSAVDAGAKSTYRLPFMN